MPCHALKLSIFYTVSFTWSFFFFFFGFTISHETRGKKREHFREWTCEGVSEWVWQREKKNEQPITVYTIQKSKCNVDSYLRSICGSKKINDWNEVKNCRTIPFWMIIAVFSFAWLIWNWFESLIFFCHCFLKWTKWKFT